MEQKTALVLCPHCDATTEVDIPEGKCLAVFTCSSCQKLTTAQKECCVVCEYSEQKCPTSEKK